MDAARVHVALGQRAEEVRQKDGAQRSSGLDAARICAMPSSISPAWAKAHPRIVAAGLGAARSPTNGVALSQKIGQQVARMHLLPIRK